MVIFNWVTIIYFVNMLILFEITLLFIHTLLHYLYKCKVNPSTSNYPKLYWYYMRPFTGQIPHNVFLLETIFNIPVFSLYCAYVLKCNTFTYIHNALPFIMVLHFSFFFMVIFACIAFFMWYLISCSYMFFVYCAANASELKLRPNSLLHTVR